MEPKERRVLVKFIEENQKQVLGEHAPTFIEAQELMDFIDEEMS